MTLKNMAYLVWKGEEMMLMDTDAGAQQSLIVKEITWLKLI